MKTVSLTVIMPNRNNDSLIGRALEAILNQSVKAAQVIFVDDYSTDNSREVVKFYARWHTQVKLVTPPHKQDVPKNMRWALDQVKTKYVMFCASDDYLLRGLFEQALADSPDVGVICSPTLLEHGKLVYSLGKGLSSKVETFSPLEAVKALREKGTFLPSNTAIWNTELLKSICGFDARLKWHADTFALHEMIFRKGMKYLPTPMGCVTVEDSSAMREGRKSKEHRDVCDLFLESVRFSKSREMWRDSGALWRLEGGVIFALLRNRLGAWITYALLKHHFSHKAKVLLKPVVPIRLANWWFKGKQNEF